MTQRQSAQERSNTSGSASAGKGAAEAGPAAAAHLGPAGDGSGQWQRFEAHELARVLSHYALGTIESIRAYRRGSRRAPKVHIVADRGEYLLKRRAAGRDDPYRVAFCHGLQLHLAERGFPLARLVGTRDGNNSMLRLDDKLYELFEFVKGQRYDRSTEEATRSGATLGALHRLLQDYQPKYDTPRGTFHGLDEIRRKLEQIPRAVRLVEPGIDLPAIKETCTFLHQAYRRSARRVNEAGYDHWAPCLLHGDWHPGNLLFRQGEVVSVIDFDSARLETRVADVANAALQFSMEMDGGKPPEEWAASLNTELLRGLLTGYDQAAAHPLGPDERAGIPWLMIEALILESVVPIAKTGMFGRLKGSCFLQMVEKKVRWILIHSETTLANMKA